jgi:S1-C subfamily serine protease
MEPGPPAESRPRGSRGLLLAGAAVLVVVIVAVLASRLGGGGAEPAAASPSPTPTPSPTVTVPDIYRRVGPSVVVIRTAKGALGTGVIVGNDGTVLTANHVISDRSAVNLVFADGTRSTATVASADPAHDVATLAPATLPQPVVPATLGGSAQVGGAVVAIGNPLGLTYSVSSGVVSATGRTAKTNGGTFSGLIQFDASVNPGSSGGPLLDGEGSVIGIVLSIADPGGDDAFAGIAFAVPIGTALAGGDGTGPGGGPQT